ncbi:MAG: Papain family cysteine protease [Syntrophorhabdaceae bacterium PtaU1.Bin034]|nr:MAG: Papain family cysteine protease [Syntrophorhabdaceae bacterium PtaU1.Bin034]
MGLNLPCLWLRSLMQLLPAFIMILLSSSAFSQATEIDDINRAIKEKGAKWVAGETSVSKLSPEEKKAILSAPLSPAEEAGTSAETPAVSALPSRYDLRDINGHNYVTPVRNQAPAGTCGYFSATGTLESRILQVSNTPDTDLDLSEQTLVSCFGEPGACGTKICGTLYEFLHVSGIPLETCFPYVGDQVACSNACPNWKNEVYRVSGWRNASNNQPTTQNIDLLKNALFTYGAIDSSLIVFDDFGSYKSGIYTHVSGYTNYGGHGIVIVGYDDEGQYFICKNSWGPDWGEGGFFRIAYSETAGSTEFGRGAGVFDGVILPGPSLGFSSSSLDFGTLTLPDQPSKGLTFTITNNGTTVLTDLFLTSTNTHFSVSPASIASLDVNASAQVTVTYTPQSGKGISETGSLQISSGSVAKMVSLSGGINTRPQTPVNQSPKEGQTGLPLTPTLTGSAFTDADGDKHNGSTWVVEDGVGGTVYSSSDFDAVNKTSLTIPGNLLSPGQTYRWYVTYRDDRLLASNASTPTSFTTSGDASNPPPDPSSPSSNPGDPSPSSGGGGGGGCFIAEAAYGSPFAREVVVLRAFRDKYLLTQPSGRYFVALYYRYSPPVAEVVRRHEVVRTGVRGVLTIVVAVLEHPVSAATGMVLVSFGTALLLFRKRRIRYGDRQET